MTLSFTVCLLLPSEVSLPSGRTLLGFRIEIWVKMGEEEEVGEAEAGGPWGSV